MDDVALGVCVKVLDSRHPRLIDTPAQERPVREEGASAMSV
jgi:hypothetical protein